VDPIGGYLVWGVCNMFSHFIHATTIYIYNDLTRNKLVLLKVILFAWRMLHNMLSTKDDLIWCRAPLANGVLSSGGCETHKM
jgi:hypothetical protein